MANPGVFWDPDHYSKRYLGTGDNGGVHINATIVTHAFYLAIEGGTNRTSGLSVQGVGAIVGGLSSPRVVRRLGEVGAGVVGLVLLGASSIAMAL